MSNNGKQHKLVSWQLTLNDIETENSNDGEGNVIGTVIEIENVLEHIVYKKWLFCWEYQENLTLEQGHSDIKQHIQLAILEHI